MFNGTELNAPLPPSAAHEASPDGTHQESMCKTDQPSCQLMRPQRINNRVETETYLVCIGFRMTNTLSCIWTLWPTPCIAVLMDYCWWSACVYGPGPPHRVGVLCVGVQHPAKQRFGVCTILIL